MRRLVILGTGCAMVTKCYNTCFALEGAGGVILVDAGGGNAILANLEKSGIDINRIHDIFLSHRHNDHTVGMIWMVRAVATQIIRGKYEGSLTIWCTPELEQVVKAICLPVLQTKFTRFFDDRIIFRHIADGDRARILDWDFNFFDIRSGKDQQFGFTTVFEDGSKLAFLGDEPYKGHLQETVKGADLLLHEAYCLYEDRDEYKPYEKSHATVKDAALNASSLEVGALLLYHTEDAYIGRRSELFAREAKAYFTGPVLVPDDLDVIDLEGLFGYHPTQF